MEHEQWKCICIYIFNKFILDHIEIILGEFIPGFLMGFCCDHNTKHIKNSVMSDLDNAQNLFHSRITC